MKSAKKIEKLVSKINVTPAGQADERLNEILAAQEESKKTSSAVSGPNIWRIIMTNKTTRITVAAVIIFAAAIGINYFGGSIEITSVAFAEIKEAMSDVVWMHQISTGFERGLKGKAEQWFGFETKVFASKPEMGKTQFYDLKENISYTYEPKDQTIIKGKVDNFPIDLASPVKMLESLNNAFTEQGAEIVSKVSKYNGRKVLLQEISMSAGQNKDETHTLKLYIDPESKRLIAAEVKATKSNGEVIMDGKVIFSYPQKGPKDIYDLGVPRDCKIIGNTGNEGNDEKTTSVFPIVDNPESWPEPGELVRSYWKARSAKEYDKMAIMWPGSESWNRKVTNDEISVEYVFGESLKAGDNVIHIPYAPKSYFAKNGKYNLKMVLTNKKSSRGRYYIISGN